jgi:hypothetical protein
MPAVGSTDSPAIALLDLAMAKANCYLRDKRRKSHFIVRKEPSQSLLLPRARRVEVLSGRNGKRV